MKIWGIITKLDYNEEEYRDFLRDVIKKETNDCDILVLDRSLLDIATGENLRFSYGGNEIELPDAFWPMISNTDALVIEKLLVNAGVKSLIDLDEFQVARSKAATYQRLAKNGIRIPKSFLFFNASDCESIVEKLGFPFVAKPDNGLGGEDVSLIHSREEFDNYLSRLKPGVLYLAQEYIATSRGRDIRVVVVDDTCVYSAMRSATNPEEFRSNVHVGGEMNEYTIDENADKLCKKIASLFDLPILGIDLLIGNGEYIVAEVNAFPGVNHDILEMGTKVMIKKLRG